MVLQFADFKGPLRLICGEWPIGLRHCISNQRVSGSKPTSRSAKRKDPTSL